MRKFLLGVLFALWTAQAQATCTTGAMPFQLQNNTLADATQVMANFNQISTSVAANCASSGANNDITSLSALTTPLTPAQGATTVFNGGLASGVNTLTISTTPSNFALTVGNRVSFIAGSTSTAATQVNVNAGGNKNLFRKTQSGAQSTQGGELIIGNPYIMAWDGTEFVLEGEVVYVGEMRDFAGATAPPGWFIADGSSFVCATFPQLCTVLGTTYGGTGANPNLPDTRGRNIAGLDNYGTAIGAASRLTSAATGCGTAFTALGATCVNANQSHTQIVAELAQHNHTDSGHTHNIAVQAGATYTGPGGNTPQVSGGATATTSASANIQNTGSSQAMPIVPHTLGMLKIIRF